MSLVSRSVILALLVPIPLMAQTPVFYGDTVRGTITRTDPVLRSQGAHYHEAIFTKRSTDPDSVLIDAMSPDFDAFLTIAGPNGYRMENDDGGDGFDARIIAPLLPGTYIIRIASLDTVGRYTLVVRRPTHDDLIHFQANQISLDPLSTSSPDQSACSGASTRVPSEESDILHPKAFTTVLERPRRTISGGADPAAIVFGPRRPEQDSDTTSIRTTSVSQNRFQAPETEVDQYSHISIEWDRKRLLEMARTQNIAITVRARVESAAGARNAEVWSYSTIGQQRRTVGTAIRNLLSLGTSACGLIHALDAHEPAIKGFLRAGDLKSAAQRLKLVLPEFKTYLGNLANPDNGTGFKIASYKRNIDPTVVVEYAQSLLRILKPLDESSDPTTVDTTVVTAFISEADFLRPVVADVASVIAAERGRVFAGQIAAEQLVAQLKDGDLFISETGARPGDRIVVEIENDALFDSIPRILKVPMRVVDFGLHQRTSDSFFFVTRIGAKPPSSDDVVDSLQSTASNGSTQTKSDPASVNFAPVPGVTYGWTYYPRSVLGSPFLTGLVRWLHPGFGLNVAFLRFGDRIVKFTQADTTVGSPATATVEESANDINIGTGLVATLFDGAVQFTRGWNISVTSKRAYWGLGFSFIRLAGVVSGSRAD